VHPSAVPPSRRRLAAVAATALLVAVGLAGCSDDDGAAPDGSSIAGLLGAVPDTKENRQYVVAYRYDAAEEGADVDPKGDDESDRELDRLLQLSKEAGIGPNGVIDTTLGPQRIGRLGFVPSDVVATVQAGSPPDTTDLAVVDADEDDVLDAAAKVEGAERTDVDGVEVVRWLDDREVDQDLDTPIGRIPGVAGRVGFTDDGLLLTATSDEVAAAAIATAKGDEPSLMDVPAIADVADALDDEDAFTAYVSVALGSDGSRTTPSQRADEQPALRSYAAIGLGNAWTDDGLELVIAIAHDDEAAAEANATALEEAVTKGTTAQTSQRLSELLSDPEVERDGTTVVGTFQVERPDLWYQFVVRFEPFLFGG